MAQYTSREIKKLKSNEANDWPWDDLRVTASAIRLPTSNPPANVLILGNTFQALSFSNTADNFSYFEVQWPHRWKEGDDVEIHIHWTIPTSGSGAGAETVCWNFNYTWANVGETFTTGSSATVTIDVQNETANKHIKTELIEHIDAKGKLASSVMLCRLWRDISEDNYGYGAHLLSVDFHYRSDSDGSYHEWYKLSDSYRKQKGNPKEKFRPGAW